MITQERKMNVTSHGHILKRHYMNCRCGHTNGMRHYSLTIKYVNCVDCLKELAIHSRWAKKHLVLERKARVIKATISYAKRLKKQSDMTKKQVKDFIKLGDEIKAYGNKMFLTVNYPVNTYTGGSMREEYRFLLVLRPEMYKRERFLFWETRYESDSIHKEFTMAQVGECRKYWLKMRDAKLPEPEWREW
jgi:hypothetical protein